MKKLRPGRIVLILFVLLIAAGVYLIVKNQYLRQMPIGTGSKAKIMCSSVFLSGRDPVVVEEPSYIGALHVFRAARARMIGVPADADGLRTDIVLWDIFAEEGPFLTGLRLDVQEHVGAAVGVQVEIGARRAVTAAVRVSVDDGHVAGVGESVAAGGFAAAGTSLHGKHMKVGPAVALSATA